eukprot:gene4291-4341_t
MILAACLATLVAPATAQQRFDGVTLRIATFGGSWREVMDKDLGPRFAALGGKLEYVTGSPQVNFAKLVAGRGRAVFDVMEILDAQEADFASVDYLAPIDPKLVPNAQALDANQLRPKLLASWTTQEGICYDTQRYKALNLPAPTTYADLANPALAGRVMIPDLNSGGGLAAFGGLMHAAGGDEVNTAPGLALIRSLNTQKYWAQGDQLVVGLQSRDLAAGLSHGGWCLRARKAGAPVAFVLPKIKPGIAGVAKEGWLGIIKSSPNLAAAHWFINEYIEAGYQLAFAKSDGVLPVHPDALRQMAKDPEYADMMPLDPDIIRHELRIDYTKVVLPDWSDHGTITRKRFLGSIVRLEIDAGLPDPILADLHPDQPAPDIGQHVHLAWDPARAVALPT